MRGDHPAFPATIDVNDDYRPGMDIRTWLAGQALAGLCAHPQTLHVSGEQVAHWAIECADATLAELSKPQ